MHRVLYDVSQSTEALLAECKWQNWLLGLVCGQTLPVLTRAQQ